MSEFGGSEMSGSPTFFLHGAGAGPWIWERVIRQLEAPALALDYAGRTTGATPAASAAAVAAELERRGIRDVVVVMHSLAGVLTRDLGTYLGDRLRRCVFISAVIPPAGDRFVDTLGFAQRTLLHLLFRLNPRGLKPSPRMIRAELCNDLTPDDVEEVVSRYQAEMPGLYLEPTGMGPVGCPSIYLKLLHDRSIKPAQQQAMASGLGDVRVHELPAGHLAMLSTPSNLVAILNEEARRLPGVR
jgi:pimeloyl-ACP methyl ester carboxylesterase